MSTKFASVEASAAWQAMKPEWRPISFTRPMPLRAPVASTWAPRIASTAAAKALSKPKLRSMKWMSLSIVFGMPTTAIGQPAPLDLGDDLVAPRAACRRRRSRTATPIPSATRRSTISPGSWLPRDVPSIVPPCWWISLTIAGVEPDRLVPVPGDQPFEAVAEAEDLLDAVGVGQLEDQPAHDVVDAGQSPPQVTMPQRSVAGSKKMRSRGPGELEGRNARAAALGVAGLRETIVEQHALGLRRRGGARPRPSRAASGES